MQAASSSNSAAAIRLLVGGAAAAINLWVRGLYAAAGRSKMSDVFKLARLATSNVRLAKKDAGPRRGECPSRTAGSQFLAQIEPELQQECWAAAMERWWRFQNVRGSK